MNRKTPKRSLKELGPVQTGGPDQLVATEDALIMEETEKAKLLDRANNDLGAFLESDEGRAREALRLRLEDLRNDPVIRTSETCIQVLNSFVRCVTLGWGAKDSEAMMRVLASTFDRMRAAQGGHAKQENDLKQVAKAMIRNKWEKEPDLTRRGEKTAFAKRMKKDHPMLAERVILQWVQTWQKEK